MHPRATYRLQLHAGFDFDAAAALAPYLAQLGVSHVYCSPYLQAQRGSRHGYDVVDHSRISDDLGGSAAHARFTEALAAAGLSQVLDIVPNHMARAGQENRWWWDVLENGPASRYAGYFDIDWDGELDKSRHTVLIPILDDNYGRVLEAGRIRITRDRASFVVAYGEQELPLSPRTLDGLLTAAAASARSAELAELATEFGRLPHARLNDREAVRRRHEDKEALRDGLAALLDGNRAVTTALDGELDQLNADPDMLDALLTRQNFRLAHWRTASEELDYRRFFTIDSMVALRVEDDAVFDDTHALVLDLVRRGVISGLRVDHVDGLRDPEGYLQRLRRASDGVWTVVEKILAPDEALAPSWPVDGTSGYEFISAINNVFVDPAHEAAMTECYASFLAQGSAQPQRGGAEPTPGDLYPQIVTAAKKELMSGELATEVDGLVRILGRVAERHRRHRDHTRAELRGALTELLAALDVYRTYPAPGRATSDVDRHRIRAAADRAARANPDLDAELLEFLAAVVLLEHPGADETEFALRFGQVSAPVMAKGAEDTAFYRYHRLISLNEVGGDPGVFGLPVASFHAAAEAAARERPAGMLTLSTHDTKRSADVRARINCLGEIPGEFQAAALRWAKRNDVHRTGSWPDREMEYLLYQTLVGSWPIDSTRVVDFMLKAAREAKVHTSWGRPEEYYESALTQFAAAVVADPTFIEELTDFLDAFGIVAAGREISLAQITLLLTCPGVPDIYQGDELWQLTLVDPDNRGAVDFPLRNRALNEVRGADASMLRRTRPLTDDPDGRIKLWLIARLLEHRRSHPEVFESAGYCAVKASGDKAAHVLAFTRGDLAVVVPRLVLGRGDHWGDTWVQLPPGPWRDVLSDLRWPGGRTWLPGLLQAFPIAVLARAA